jgi:hypothetical protein
MKPIVHMHGETVVRQSSTMQDPTVIKQKEEGNTQTLSIFY